MKKFKIVFSELAKKDLTNIYNYVTDISSEENAVLVVDRIAKRIAGLDVFPERSEGFKVGEDGELIRVTISGRYRAFYYVDKKAQKVVIARIMSVSQKTPKT